MIDVCCLPLKRTVSPRANDNGSRRSSLRVITAVVSQQHSGQKRHLIYISVARARARTSLVLEIQQVLAEQNKLTVAVNFPPHEKRRRKQNANFCGGLTRVIPTVLSWWGPDAHNRIASLLKRNRRGNVRLTAKPPPPPCRWSAAEKPTGRARETGPSGSINAIFFPCRFGAKSDGCSGGGEGDGAENLSSPPRLWNERKEYLIGKLVRRVHSCGRRRQKANVFNFQYLISVTILLEYDCVKTFDGRRKVFERNRENRCFRTERTNREKFPTDHHITARFLKYFLSVFSVYSEVLLSVFTGLLKIRSRVPKMSACNQ